jgi:hypothetical protein
LIRALETKALTLSPEELAGQDLTSVLREKLATL